MPRIAAEARITSAYAKQNPPPAPPDILTEEQKGYWRGIVQDLAAGHIKSDNAPVLIELVRAMSYASQIAEEMTKLRTANLLGSDEDREAFAELLKLAGEQTRTICLTATKLRLTVQSRTDSVAVGRRRERTPTTGRRPWEPLETAQGDGDGLDS